MRHMAILAVLVLSLSVVFVGCFDTETEREQPVSAQSVSLSLAPGTETLDDFPVPDELARKMTDAGFRDVGQEPLSLGIAWLHWGTRQ